MWRTAPLQARTIGQGLEVKPSTLLGAGRGLFTTVVIPKNEFITSFTGRIIGHKEALKLREQHETGYYCSCPSFSSLQAIFRTSGVLRKNHAVNSSNIGNICSEPTIDAIHNLKQQVHRWCMVIWKRERQQLKKAVRREFIQRS